MKNIKKWFHLGSHRLIVSAIAVLLVACGGDSGDNPPQPGGGTGGGFTGSTYLFYSGSLMAVDPANPTSPITIEAGSDIVTGSFGLGSSVRTVRSGTYDTTTQTLTNLHSHALIYAKTNGRLYRVSALKSGTLTPVQVSSEGAADQMCKPDDPDDVFVRSDFANPDNSQLIYALPGVDGFCGTSDDEWKMVRLGMSTGEAPVTARPPVTVLGDTATGAIAGWLVNDAGALKKCDANFTNCGPSIALVATKVDLELDLGLNQFLLNIDDQLFVYNADTNILSTSIFAVPATTVIRASAADDTHIFFENARSIYRAPIDGSAAASVIGVETEDTTFQISVTSNKVVYMVGGVGVGMELKALDKTGGVSTTLATAATGNFGMFFVNGNTIYYSFGDQQVSGPGRLEIVALAAGWIDENGGSNSELADAAWVATYSDTVDLSKSSTLAVQSQKMIRVEGYGQVGSGMGFAGATLNSFDAATTAPIATLGTLPVTDSLASITCLAIGDNALCNTLVNITPVPTLPALPFQQDIFFINTAAANSLMRVTNSANESETAVTF